MTVTPRELAHAAPMHAALVELNNAAHAARPFVASHAAAARARGMHEVAGDSSLILERLDAALADAGEILSAVTP